MPESHVSTFLDDLPSYDFTHAFLSRFSDFRETHDLLPLELPPDCDLPLDIFLSDVETGSLEPTCSDNDEPSWREALSSPEWEYWIAGARDELRSLQDLQVFILVPRSAVPKERCVLKGKLVCKRKRDDAGKIRRSLLTFPLFSILTFLFFISTLQYSQPNLHPYFSFPLLFLVPHIHRCLFTVVRRSIET